jgi:hypothetical protein
MEIATDLFNCRAGVSMWKKFVSKIHLTYVRMTENKEKIGEAFTSLRLRNVPRNKNVIFVLVNQEIDFWSPSRNNFNISV